MVPLFGYGTIELSGRYIQNHLIFGSPVFSWGWIAGICFNFAHYLLLPGSLMLLAVGGHDSFLRYEWLALVFAAVFYFLLFYAFHLLLRWRARRKATRKSSAAEEAV